MKSIPMVYEGPYDTLPNKPFNAILLSIDARLESDLNWKEVDKKAEALTQKGFQILWDLNLGLFDELPLPLSDTTQYKSLHLSLDHFFETLWAKYKNQTIGAVLYKGTVDWVHQWNWDPDQLFSLENRLIEVFESTQSLYNATGVKFKDFQSFDIERLKKNKYGHHFLKFFCLSAAIDYFEVLSAQFPNDLLPYVLFDLKDMTSKLQTFQLLQHEAFDFIQLALKNSPIEMPHTMGWQTTSMLNGFIGKEYLEYEPIKGESSRSVLVPAQPIYDESQLAHYEKYVQEYENFSPIRYLSERQLTLDWQGLDEILVLECSPDTKRKLEGFIAAGGQVIYIEKPLQLSEECSFTEYKKQKRNS